MKKILLLGGSAQQIIAIETAKRLGYYTILCDYLPDNPGQNYADKFYQESTTDKETILKIAQEERIDGILAYASDPAAPTAAYVSEKMNLRGIPFKSVEILCNKDKFRVFLEKNGFSSPLACGYGDKKSALLNVHKFNLPIIVKPVDSSGSKGTTVLHSLENIDTAIEFAFSFSRSKRIIIEEFIEKKHEYLIGGDIIVYNGKVILWGLLNCHRDKNVNPLVPVGKSFPLLIKADDIELVKNTLQDIVAKLNISNAAMNVELVIDKNNKVWPIDIGPRNGGNMIPNLLGNIFDVDVVEMAVKLAMGEKIKTDIYDGEPFYATHNLHSSKNGVFKGVEFSKEIEKYIFRKNIYKSIGDKVEYFDNASKAIGIVFLKFNNQEQMEEHLKAISEHIHINVAQEY